jgi:hypothetical protein
MRSIRLMHRWTQSDDSERLSATSDSPEPAVI